jgi:hypothetical protein
MPMPDFTNLFLDRFAICNAEIAGADHVNRVAPLEINPSNNRLPMLYTMPDIATTIKRTVADVQLTRDYLITGLVKAVALDKRGAIEGDSELVMRALDFEHLVMDYYLSHPRLHTASLDELAFIAPGQQAQIVSSSVITLDRIIGDNQPKRPAYAGILMRLRTVVQYRVLSE